MARRKTVSILFTTLAAGMAVSAVAWACTPSAYLFPVAPASGQAGSQVTLRGGQFGDGPVEIRFDSERGKILGTALGPDFSITVQIPDSSPGVHYLVAIARDPANPANILARRAEALELKAPVGTRPQTTSPWDTAAIDSAQQTNNTGRSAGIAAATVGMAFVVASGAVILGRRKRARA